MFSVVLLAVAPAVFSPAFGASPQAENPQAAAPAVPERNGNIWGGEAHQPSRGQVESAEEHAREITPQQEQKTDDEVTKIQRQLEQTEQHFPPGFLNSKP